MDIAVRTTTRSQVPVVQVTGTLDVHTANALRHELSDLTRVRHSKIVVDLTGVGFIDSTGLGVLVRGRQAGLRLGVDVHLVIDNPAVLRVFRISSLARLFVIHRTLDAALTAAMPEPV